MINIDHRALHLLLHLFFFTFSIQIIELDLVASEGNEYLCHKYNANPINSRTLIVIAPITWDKPSASLKPFDFFGSITPACLIKEKLLKNNE